MLKLLKFNELRFKYKLLIYTNSLVIFVTIVLSIFFQNQFKKNISYNLEDKHHSILNQIQKDIHFLQTNLEEIATFLCIDKNLSEVLTKKTTSVIGDFYYSNTSLSYIMNIFVSKSFISSVIIYGENEHPVFYLFTDEKNTPSDLSKVKKQVFYERTYTYKGKPYWIYLDNNDNTIINNNTDSRLALTKLIINPNNVNNIIAGLLVMTIDTKEIESLISNTINNDYESFILTDTKGNKLYSYGNEHITNDYVNNSTNTYIVSEMVLPETDWKLNYVTDKQYLYKNIPKLSTITLFIIALCLAITFTLSYIVSKHLNLPISNLLQSMRRFEKGHFDEQVKIINHDEIGQLSIGYNTMAQNTQRLIDEIYISKMKEKQAELNLLQAQINPHFLYNTLDTIYWKLLASKQTETSEMIFSLSQVFRLSLSKGKEFITIKDEIELVKYYLSLQKKRFTNKLDYSIHIDETITNSIIPKLIIQPFVENSIVHGLEHGKSNVSITVSAVKQKDIIVITIKDNGCGFDTDILNKKTDKDSYAILNIKERLNIIYRNKHKLYIESKIGQGTTITIHLIRK